MGCLDAFSICPWLACSEHLSGSQRNASLQVFSVWRMEGTLSHLSFALLRLPSEVQSVLNWQKKKQTSEQRSRLWCLPRIQDTHQQIFWRVVNKKKKKGVTFNPFFIFEIHSRMGSLPLRLNPVCSGAVRPAERPSFAKQSERRLAVIGNPFLHFHCTAIPDKLITIKCWLQQGAPYTIGKKNEASRWSDSRIFQLTPLDWTRGRCGFPVATTTHKQTARSASQDLVDPIRPSLGPTGYLNNQCFRERRRASSWWDRDAR